MISFTGIVTFKNADADLLEVVNKIPADRYMLETDSPYLAPTPMRGKTNQPAYVRYIAEHVANIRGEDFTTVAQQTTNNAITFFDLVK